MYVVCVREAFTCVMCVYVCDLAKQYYNQNNKTDNTLQRHKILKCDTVGTILLSMIEDKKRAKN
jgi:hypothetical protein